MTDELPPPSSTSSTASDTANERARTEELRHVHTAFLKYALIAYHKLVMPFQRYQMDPRADALLPGLPCFLAPLCSVLSRV